jgi:hypothetical protein
LTPIENICCECPLLDGIDRKESLEREGSYHGEGECHEVKEGDIIYKILINPSFSHLYPLHRASLQPI